MSDGTKCGSRTTQYNAINSKVLVSIKFAIHQMVTRWTSTNLLLLFHFCVCVDSSVSFLLCVVLAVAVFWLLLSDVVRSCSTWISSMSGWHMIFRRGELFGKANGKHFMFIHM